VIFIRQNDHTTSNRSNFNHHDTRSVKPVGFYIITTIGRWSLEIHATRKRMRYCSVIVRSHHKDLHTFETYRTILQAVSHRAILFSELLPDPCPSSALHPSAILFNELLPDPCLSSASRVSACSASCCQILARPHLCLSSTILFSEVLPDPCLSSASECDLNQWVAARSFLVCISASRVPLNFACHIGLRRTPRFVCLYFVCEIRVSERL
jgi:hypothetical protein